MNSSSDSKPRIIALVATTIVAILLLLWMMRSGLNFTSTDEMWPPREFTEVDILDEDEAEKFYEMAYATSEGDNIMEQNQDSDDLSEGSSSDEQSQFSYDDANAGAKEGDQTNLVPSNAPFDITHTNVKNPGNRQPTPEEIEAREKAAREQASRENIDNLMAFGAGGQATGKPADNNGKTDSKGNTGGDGLSMTASHDVSPKSDKLGTIVINVVVLPDGKIKPGSAKYNPAKSKGEAAADKNLRDACLLAACKCQFSRPTDSQSTLPGTITFKFEDKKQ